MKKGARRQRPIGPMKMKSNLLTLTPYRYKFQLLGQVLTSTAVAGQLQFSGVSGAGQYPLAIASSVTVQASSSGIPGFYDVFCATPFRLSDLVNQPTFSAMYDAYKFGKVTLNLEYLNNVSAVNTSGLMPTCYFYWDQDDAVIPSTVQTISSRQGVKVRQFGDRSKTTLRTSFVPVPSVVTTTGVGATPLTTAIIPNKSQWMNCASPSVAHNALKIAITDLYLPGAGVNQAFRFNWTYHVSFRAPLLTC